MFRKVLIANRGEIACRILKTCRQLGLGSVAVYSDADRGSLHTLWADEAWPIGPAAPAESYLSIDRLLEVARRSGADAVHPGYGFLSEQADFCRRVEEAGLVFVGPRPETISLMGSKREAKALMARNGIPVVPGYDGTGTTLAAFRRAAARIGFPLLVKAVFGGGGRGMRLVRNPGELEDALAGARREAESGFGDGALLLERYIEHPRHIEVQIVGDQHGNQIHLFERECTLQRRYQKVWEEAPSSLLGTRARAELLAAAVQAARAVDYRGAGTVEFVVGPEGDFYFLEMNTRLQVEHPVTETVTGLDLVALQFEIAAGRPLSIRQEEVRCEGHAIEVRLYAEDPARGFLPAAGPLDLLHLAPDLRIDRGFQAGDRLGTDYDALIAKLIAGGPDRATALTRMREALARSWVDPVPTNLALLSGLAAHPDVAEGRFDTGFIAERLEELLAPQPVLPHHWAALAWTLLNSPPATAPWQHSDGFRVGGLAAHLFVTHEGQNRTLCIRPLEAGAWRLEHEEGSYRVEGQIRDAEEVWIGVDGEFRPVHLLRAGDRFHIACRGIAQVFTLRTGLGTTGSGGPDAPGAGCLSPFPGRILEIRVKPGATVAAGEALLVLEGMKIEYTVKAQRAGRIASLLCAVGDAVTMDQPLLAFEEESPP
jgi:3-methylcrotonyl-CoA carboxylase alpha subunit